MIKISFDRVGHIHSYSNSNMLRLYVKIKIISFHYRSTPKKRVKIQNIHKIKQKRDHFQLSANFQHFCNTNPRTPQKKAHPVTTVRKISNELCISSSSLHSSPRASKQATRAQASISSDWPKEARARSRGRAARKNVYRTPQCTSEQQPVGGEGRRAIIGFSRLLYSPRARLPLSSRRREWRRERRPRRASEREQISFKGHNFSFQGRAEQSASCVSYVTHHACTTSSENSVALENIAGILGVW